MRVINPSKNQQLEPIDFNTFNPLCKVQQAGDGSLYVKMMLQQTPLNLQQGHQHQQLQQQHQHWLLQQEQQQAMMMQQDQPSDHPTLKKYIDGWIDFKEKRKMNSKYERYWFVLKGQFLGGGQLTSAFLFCFKDNNTHIKKQFVGSTQIDVSDTVELHKIEGSESKPWKCEFTIKINGKTKMQFRAQDNIQRDRWIYALVDLVGQQLPPSDLPTMNNGIRPRDTKLSSSIRKLPRDITDAMVLNDPSMARMNGSRASMPNIGTPGTQINGTPPFITRNEYDQHNGTPPYIGSRMGSQQSGPVNATLNGKSIKDALESRRATIATTPRTKPTLKETRTYKNNLGNCPWYYGPMSRNEAELELRAQHVGSYLLRDCQSKRGCFTLTFKDQEKIKNHMIEPQPGNNFQFNGPEFTRTFQSPEDGVLYYMDIKRNRNFVPKPYIKRLPGDGQEDNSYIESEEINPLNEADIKPKQKDFRPKMVKSPSLPEQYSVLESSEEEGNGLNHHQYENTALSPKSTHFNAPHLTKTSSLSQLPQHSHHGSSRFTNQRRISAIERPTFERRLPSLNDHYEEPDRPIISPTSTTSSLKKGPSGDDSYILGSELGLDSEDPKNSDLKRLSYVDKQENHPGETNKQTRRTSGYNAPLPPTPERPEFITDGVDLRNDTSYLEPDSVDGYLKMDAAAVNTDNDIPSRNYNTPLPPTPTSPPLSPSIDDHEYMETEDLEIEVQSENGYLDMHQAGTETLPIDDYCKMNPHNATNGHYVAMNENNPKSSYSFPRPVKIESANQPDLNSKRGSLVLPQPPKTQIKKKAGSMQMKPTYLSRQPTSPLLPSAPGSKVKENTKLLKQLKLDPIPQPAEDYKKRLVNNNSIPNDGPSPPVPPPRKAKPQRLPNQKSTNSQKAKK